MGSMPPPAAAALQQAFGLIDRQVLGAPAASISFAGLDTANKMFRLTVYIIKDAAPGTPNFTLNNDGGANYDRQYLLGNAAAVTAARAVNQTSISFVSNPTANEHTAIEALIAKQQTGDEAMLIADQSPFTAAIRRESIAGIWNNLLALISRVDINQDAGNFDTGTVAILEGNATT